MEIVKTLLSWLLPIGTISLVVFVQILFWRPSDDPEEVVVIDASSNNNMEESSSTSDNPTNHTTQTTDDSSSSSVPRTSAKEHPKQQSMDEDNDDDEDLFQMNDTWRCACENGFLPPGMLKTFGNAEAMIRLGTGQCYHKQS